MGSFEESLVLLKEGQEPKPFISKLHQKLKDIDFILEIDDYEYIVFNDTRDEKEKEPISLKNSMSENEVIHELCSWKGLGLLSYRHPNFQFQVSINYVSWDDILINGFTISFYGKDVIFREKAKKDLLLEIANLVDYKYVVGDIDNTSKTYIHLEQKLPKIINYIENHTFEIDIRK